MLLFDTLLWFVASCQASHHLQMNAVVSDNEGRAKIECWQFSASFKDYPTLGRSISGLADVSNISYVTLPPRSTEGVHKPPHAMFFVLLSGLAHVSLLDGDDELWIMEGLNNMIVAADTVGVGHVTDYPSDKPTVALQIPLKDGNFPDHRVAKRGSCPVSGEWKIDDRSQITTPQVVLGI